MDKLSDYNGLFSDGGRRKTVIFNSSGAVGLFLMIAAGVALIFLAGFAAWKIKIGNSGSSLAAVAVQTLKNILQPAQNYPVLEIKPDLEAAASGTETLPAENAETSANFLNNFSPSKKGISDGAPGESNAPAEPNDTPKISAPEKTAENFSAASSEMEDGSPQISTSKTETAQPAAEKSGGKNLSGEKNHIIISEVMAGEKDNSYYEFVELYNSGTAAVDLSNWSVKKKNSSGSESALVSAVNLKGKEIPAGKYFLLANSKISSALGADVYWPKSYALAYKNNSVELYNGDVKIDEAAWSEIPADESYERQPVDGSFIIETNPNPQNSSR